VGTGAQLPVPWGCQDMFVRRRKSSSPAARHVRKERRMGVALGPAAIRGHAGNDGRYPARRTACGASTVSRRTVNVGCPTVFSKLPGISLVTL
jgi:hypothetical protein